MKPVWKWSLILLLLVLCLGIGIRFDMDLVTYFFTARFAHYDLTRVYALNWDLGPYFYGPVTLPFLLPFAKVGYPVFKGISLVIDSFCFLLTWFVLHSLFPSLRSTKNFIGWVLLWIFAINPFHHHFQSHNVQVILAGILFAAEYLAVRSDSRSRFAGGFLCGIAGMAKMFPLFLCAYYVLARPKEVRAGVFAGLLFSLAFPIVVFGLGDGTYLYESFVSGLTGYQNTPGNSLATTGEILSLPSLIARLMPPGSALADYEPLAFRTLFVSIASLFLWKAWRTRSTTEVSPSWGWAIACGLMVFLNPGARVHFFMFYLPALAVLNEIFYSQTSTRLERYLALAAMVVSVGLVAFTTDFVVGKGMNNLLEFRNIPTYGTIVLMTVAWIGLQKWVDTKRLPGY